MNIITPSGDTFVIDKGNSRATTPRVIKFSFGDGYTQRLAQGINVLEESFAVSFNNRPKAEIDILVAYFESLYSSVPFGFSPPDYPEIAATVTYDNTTKTIVYNSGTDFTSIIPYNYVLVSSNTTKGNFSLNKALNNSSVAMTIYNGVLTTSSSIASTIRAGIGVVCESWNVTYVNSATLSLNANLIRDYTP